MSDFSDLRSEFVSEFAAVGIWIPIRVTSTDSPPVVTDISAGYAAPDVVLQGSQISDQHEIEYRTEDLPALREGHRVDFLDEAGAAIAGKAFKVREPGYVDANSLTARDGYWRRALLTKL